MTSAQVVETSVTNNSPFQDYSHPDDHTRRTTDTPGFKPFTIQEKLCYIYHKQKNKAIYIRLTLQSQSLRYNLK